MSNMTGTVQAVRKDNKGFLLLEAGGEENWYSAPMKTTLPANVTKGSEVELTYTVNGAYRNIDKGSLKLAEQATPSKAATASGKTPGSFFPVKLDTKDHIIMRQNALTAASNVAYHCMPAGATAEDILELAEQFVTWTTGHAGE